MPPAAVAAEERHTRLASLWRWKATTVRGIVATRIGAGLLIFAFTALMYALDRHESGVLLVGVIVGGGTAVLGIPSDLLRRRARIRADRYK
jgi:hypothetical protein